MNDGVNAFARLTRHPVKFRMFLLSRLPSAWFSGVRIRSISAERCETTITYKWFTKNPFRSTYFACLSMAAEMSTGALAMAHLYRREIPISLLVVKVESEYFKKATGRTTFTCEDGEGIRRTIEKALENSEPASFRARSIGRNDNGEVVAEFFVTWSFKKKK